MADRDIDIAVFGATGFVGRLVARYLAEHAPDGVRVALAGRKRSKLETVRSGLPPAARDWPLLVADSTDAASLTHLAEASRVVLTTVGPVRDVRATARAGMRPGRHALRGPDRGDHLPAGGDRRVRRTGTGVGGADRADVRGRLHPLRYRGVGAGPAGRRRR